MYDLMMRLPLLAWVLLCTTMQSRGLVGVLNAAPADSVYFIHIAMRLSTIAFLVLLVAAVILRTRPSAKASGLEPRISALIGTFLITAIVLFPRRELSPAAGIVSTLLILTGNALAVYVLMQLGRSFSVMAEARRLVTTGVYRIVRHPLYLAEELAVFGMVMQFLSFWTALLLAVQIAFQLRRMRNEETILGETFPEYGAYKTKTARLIPGIY